VPTYSAVKWKGKPLYHWARKGVPVERPTKDVIRCTDWTLVNYAPPDFTFHVDCSKGFYVRSLARDLGEKLGVGGTLAALTRETIGTFKRTDAYPWVDRSELNKELFERSFIPIEKLPDYVRAGVSPDLSGTSIQKNVKIRPRSLRSK
jgi:tRNA pseudouridine55 synthase